MLLLCRRVELLRAALKSLLKVRDRFADAWAFDMRLTTLMKGRTQDLFANDDCNAADL